MISDVHEKDLLEIADKLGYEEQSMQLIEEMAELTQAISKYRRYNDTEELLNLIAERMNAKVVRWKTVDEAIEKGISFTILVDTSSYITEEERKMLEDKCKVY